MAVLDPVLAHVAHLRALEAAAAADPGYVSDRDHVESVAWTAYDEAWKAVPRLINSEPKPDIWLALHQWCAKNAHHFGSGYTTMHWNPRGRSLHTTLLDAVLQRAEERQARPDDEAVWSDPRLESLLRAMAEAPADERVASILALLPEAEPVITALPDGPLRTTTADLSAGRARLVWHGLQLTSDLLTVTLDVAFSESLEPDDPVFLALVELETRADTGIAAQIVRRHGDPLSAKGLSLPRGSRVSLSPGQLRVSVPRGACERLAEAGHAVLSLSVRGVGPWFLAGHVRAPTGLDAVAAAVKARLRSLAGTTSPDAGLLTRLARWFGRSGSRAPEAAPQTSAEAARQAATCERCGDATPVLLNGNCPPCEVGEVTAFRPLHGADAEQHEVVRRDWADTRCPACGGRTFRSRGGPGHYFMGAWRCEACRKGWIIDDGRVQGPDWFDVALAAQAPSHEWKSLIATVADWGLCHCYGDINRASRFVRLARTLRGADVAPEWRALLLQLADALELRHKSPPLIYDTDDSEFQSECVQPVLAAARGMRELLGGAPSA